MAKVKIVSKKPISQNLRDVFILSCTNMTFCQDK